MLSLVDQMWQIRSFCTRRPGTRSSRPMCCTEYRRHVAMAVACQERVGLETSAVACAWTSPRNGGEGYISDPLYIHVPARFPSQRLIPLSVGTHPSVNGMSRSRCHRNVSNRQYARQAYFKYPTRARRLQGRQYHYGEILTQRPDKCKQSFVALDNFNCSSPTSPKHTETSLLNADHASHVYLIISVQPMLSNSPARQRRWSIARYMLDS